MKFKAIDLKGVKEPHVIEAKDFKHALLLIQTNPEYKGYYLDGEINLEQGVWNNSNPSFDGNNKKKKKK